ncbi:MAG: hypothetical protein J0L97_04360 [Alphaproteobacteria bacterium]|nr:hypothetical protein [Alphaproteobacteria bacterium]
MPHHSIHSLPTPLGTLHTFLLGGANTEATCKMEAAIPELVEGMTVEKCFLIRWNINAETETAPFAICCEWDKNDSVENGRADSGQFFAAQTWEGNGYTLTLGTGDGEVLSLEAHKGNNIPRRFSAVKQTGTSFDNGELDWVEYTERGFRIQVPSLKEHEALALLFAAAWKPHPSPEDASTWFAARALSTPDM